MSDRRRRDLVSLLVALAVILALAFWVFRPFLLDFAVAACVALLLAPLQKRLTAAFGGRPGLAAALLVLVTTALILVPVLSSLLDPRAAGGGLPRLAPDAVALEPGRRAAPLAGPAAALSRACGRGWCGCRPR